jgi:NAD(P)-dependent dehydrogenase (short-subunit alcohol dehydrogenase family)
MELRGKVALVTGGAVRVGRAITLGLAAEGADVVVHYHRSAGAAGETAAEARRLGVEALTVPADLGDPEAAQAVAAQAEARFGGVDVLIHGASPFVAGALPDLTLDDWRRVMGPVEGFLLLAQGLAPGMVARGAGVIVTLLDRGAFDPWPTFLAHGAAKATLWALTRSLAAELAPEVRVNGIVPGPVLPPPGYTPAQEARAAGRTLLQRWGRPQDVVEAVRFLVHADYVTGEALFVDGGERWAHRRRPSHK